MDLLLRHAGRPVGLTEAGERTVTGRAGPCRLRTTFAPWRAKAGAASGSIAMATSHAHATYLLLPAIIAFSQRFPKVRITVLQGTPGQTAELVRDGKATLGVTHAPGELPKETVAVPFLTSQRVLVAPAGHPLLKEEELTLAKIAEHPLIVSHSARPGGSRILQRLEEAGLEANVVVQALDPDVIKTYVVAGLGIGIIPAFGFAPHRDRRCARATSATCSSRRYPSLCCAGTACCRSTSTSSSRSWSLRWSGGASTSWCSTRLRAEPARQG
jgi:DNA-binding transcriptional LysR family regulator